MEDFVERFGEFREMWCSENLSLKVMTSFVLCYQFSFILDERNQLFVSLLIPALKKIILSELFYKGMREV